MPVPVKKILTCSLLVLLVAIFAIGYMVYDQLSDIDQLKATLVESLEKQTHRKISIGRAELGFVSGMNIKLSNISVRNPVVGKPEFTAREVRMIIKLLPLLRKKVEFRKFILDSPAFQITRSAEGKFSYDDLRDIFSHQDENQPETRLIIFHENLIPKVEIINGEVRFLDFYQQSSPDPRDIQIHNINLTLGKNILQAPFTYSLHAEIPNADRNAVFDISGKIRGPSGNLHLASLSLEGTAKIHDLYLPKFKSYFPEKAVLLFGENMWLSSDSGFSATLGGGITMSGKVAYLPQPENGNTAISDPGKTNHGNIVYKMSINKEKTQFEQLDFHSGEFSLTGQGSVSRMNDGKISFSIQSSEFLVDKTEQYPPLLLFPKSTHDLIKKIFKNGTLQINTIKFNGTFDQLNNLGDQNNLNLLEADLSIKKVDWTLPLPPFQKVNGSLKLQSGELTTDLNKSFYQGVPVAKLTGSIKNLTDHAMLDWFLQSEVDLAQLHKALPKILEDNSFDSLLDYYSGIQGTGAIVITFKGPMESSERLAIDGKLSMNDATFKQKNLLPLPVAGLKGQVNFNHPPRDPADKVTATLPWHVTFADFSGIFGKNSFSNLNAEISLVNGKPFIKSSGDLKLRPEEKPVVLTDSFPLEGDFQSYLQQTVFLDGEIYTNFHSEGNPMIPESSKDWGTLELKNLKLKSQKGFRPLSNLSGSLSYSESGIKLKNIQGNYGKSPIHLEGEVGSGANSNWLIHAKSPGFLYEDLKDVPFFETLEYSGPAKMDFNLNGSSQLLKFENKIDLSRTSYKYKDVLVKNADIPNKLLMKGRVAGGKTIALDQLAYELGDNKVSGKGTIKSIDDPVFTVNLSTQNFNISPTKMIILSLGTNPRGSINLDIHGKGNLKQFDTAVFEGNAEMATLTFQPENFPKPLTIKGKIKFINDQYDFSEMQLTSGKSSFRMSGGYKSGAQPALNISLAGKTIVLEDFFSAGKNTDMATALQSAIERSELLSQGTSKVALTAGQLNFKFWRLKNAEGIFLFKNKKLEVNRLDAYARDNPIRGQGMISLADPKVIQFETAIAAKDISIERLLDLFGPTFGDSLTGNLKILQARFKSRGNNWNEIKKSLNGKLLFKVASGKINTTQLKDGVFDLFGFSEKMDDSRKQGISSPFERIMGDFVIHDGIAETEKFAYLTADRGTSLVGSFDLNQNTMNTVVGVAPMPGLDKLLTQIPVVGRIITGGDEESLIKTYYSVEGEFSNPKVTAIPLTSLGKKAVGILQGILQTPQEIFSIPREKDATE